MLKWYVMRTFALLAATLVALAISPAQAQPGLTAEQARAELDQVYAAILERHPDPFWYTPEPIWQDRLNTLRRREGPISVVQQYFDLSSLMALAMDTHVQI